MKVGLISNSINFRGTDTPVRLNSEERKEIKEKAKAFEDKLIKLGQDGFIKRHEDVRKEQFDIYCRAQYTMDGEDWDFKKDTNPNFKTPENRFQYLLRKAKKYQTDEAIDKFTDEKEKEFSKTIEQLKEKIDGWKKQIKDAESTIQTLLTNRTEEIKAGTISLMGKKIIDLEKFFRESQEISPRHKEVKQDLEAGILP